MKYRFEILETRGEEAPFLNGINSVLIHDDLFSFGGSPQIGTYINETFKFSILDQKFEKLQVKGEIPKERILHSAVNYQNELYIWGGTPFYLEASNQFHKFNPNTNNWSIVECEKPIPSRFGHTMNLYEGIFILFGGFCRENDYSNDIRMFCVKKKEWSEIIPKNLAPEKRYIHSSFVYKTNLFIFGGMSESRPLKDFWRFNFETLMWNEILISDYLHNVNHLQFLFQDTLYFVSGTKLISYHIGLSEFKEEIVDDLPLIHNSSSVFHKGSLYIYGGIDHGIGKIEFGFKDIDLSCFEALKKKEFIDLLIQTQN